MSDRSDMYGVQRRVGDTEFASLIRRDEQTHTRAHAPVPMVRMEAMNGARRDSVSVDSASFGDEHNGRDSEPAHAFRLMCSKPREVERVGTEAVLCRCESRYSLAVPGAKWGQWDLKILRATIRRLEAGMCTKSTTCVNVPRLWTVTGHVGDSDRGQLAHGFARCELEDFVPLYSGAPVAGSGDAGRGGLTEQQLNKSAMDMLAAHQNDACVFLGARVLIVWHDDPPLQDLDVVLQTPVAMFSVELASRNTWSLPLFATDAISSGGAMLHVPSLGVVGTPATRSLAAAVDFFVSQTRIRSKAADARNDAAALLLDADPLAESPAPATLAGDEPGRFGAAGTSSDTQFSMLYGSDCVYQLLPYLKKSTLANPALTTAHASDIPHVECCHVAEYESLRDAIHTAVRGATFIPVFGSRRAEEHKGLGHGVRVSLAWGIACPEKYVSSVHFQLFFGKYPGHGWQGTQR